MDEDHHPSRRPGSATDVPLPPERAFVVQLRPLDDPRGEVLVGRVEHITSGAVGRFTSAAELTAFIARIGRAASAGEHDETPGDP
ncbi:hypothetical protein K2Z84_14330 [Candidatus Binatia bacterium]|nr:hypothetical protein [Candidatus Binatia bacterium]